MGGRDKGNTFFISGAFCEAKNEIWRRRKSPPSPFGFGRASEGGQKFPACRQAGFPPTPFLFARPSANLFQNSASGFSRKKVRISFSIRSQIVCSAFVASALRASAGRLYSICQDFFGSIATFCESKTRFAVAGQRANKSL
jgi:hypothetical protein